MASNRIASFCYSKNLLVSSNITAFKPATFTWVNAPTFSSFNPCFNTRSISSRNYSQQRENINIKNDTHFPWMLALLGGAAAAAGLTYLATDEADAAQDTKARFSYYNLKGRGELIRLILEETGTAYDFNVLDDKKIEELRAAKLLPFNQVPFYEEGDYKLVQSDAIARYLARSKNLYGKNPRDGLIDQVCEGVKDLIDAYIKAYYQVEEAKRPEAKANLYSTTVPKFYGFFEALLLKNNGGKEWLVGDRISLADLSLYNISDIFETENPGGLDKFPLLKAHRERVAARPNIKAYNTSGRRPAH